MKNSQLLTFREILKEGILLPGDNEEKIIKETIDCIYIPKIQRDYAQGRASEEETRKDFIEDIFETLKGENKEDEVLELSFIFGSRQQPSSRSCYGLEVLDGQQRLTTLFLLYWYIAKRENPVDKMPDFLNKFTYETRDTSTYFLSNITHEDEKLQLRGDVKPSKIIRSRKWFTDEFSCDPTVNSIMGMIDEIHKQYQTLDKDVKLYPKLELLKFYVLMLKNFSMPDELYIKMNSRGLSLTPFENFKADLVRYMKKHKADYDEKFTLEFISRIDALWIDLFWQPDLEPDEEVKGEIIIDDKEIGWKYFTFFNRYFYTKAAQIEGIVDNNEGNWQNFFRTTDESEEMKKRLKGWKSHYLPFLQEFDGRQEKPEDKIFRRINKVFNTLHAYSGKIVDEIRKDPFGNLDTFSPEAMTITYPERVAFAGIVEFIEAIPEGMSFKDEVIETNFRRFCRILYNVIENTILESSMATVRLIGALTEILHLEGALSDNLYKAVAFNPLNSNNEQLKEEAEKCREMFDHEGNFLPEWEKVFSEAERHPFFKGAIRSFFNPKSGSATDFKKRYEEISTWFDKEGIAPGMREEHLLMRGLMSGVNYWKKGLEDLYITENVEKEKYLKNFILGHEEIKSLFCDYFLLKEKSVSPVSDFKVYLRDEIIVKGTARATENTDFEILYDKLTKSSDAAALLDWITSTAKEKKKLFRLMSEDKKALVAKIPRNWYDNIVLSNQRGTLIPVLMDRCNLKYEDDSKDKWQKNFRDYIVVWDVSVYKYLKDSEGRDIKLVITFTYDKRLIFKVTKYHHILAAKLGLPLGKDELVLKTGTYQYDTPEERDRIAGELADVEALIIS